MTQESILKKVRREGYNEGWSQASMVAYDDAYEKGKLEVRQESPSRLLWFINGIQATIIVGLIIYYVYM